MRHSRTPVDQMFEALEKKSPNHFAVRQYKLFKLSADKTAKNILTSCGAQLAPFDIAELREITRYMTSWNWTPSETGNPPCSSL